MFLKPLKFLLCMASLGLWEASAQAQTLKTKVKICRFESSRPVITNEMADQILRFCTSLMHDNGCDIEFVRDGDVKVLPDDQFGGVLTNDNFNYYESFLRNYNIRIFNEVAECSSYSGPFAGCSSMRIYRMAVNGSAQTRNNSLLWLHEFGHNCNLLDINPQNDGAYDPTKIMNGYLSDTNRGLRGNECSYYLSTVNSVARTDSFDLVSLAEVRSGQRNQQEARQPQKVPVKEFVRRIYPHGIPYDLAKEYGPADVKVLLEMLYDPEAEAEWPNIVATLCLIGDPSAIEPLTRFYEQGEGKISPHAYQAKKGVLQHLGELINASKDKKGQKFLFESVSGTGGLARKPRWIPPYGANNGVSDRLLADSALTGVALSGSQESLDLLKKIKQEGTASDSKVNFDKFIRINETVMQKGLGRFLNEKDVHQTH